jgi:hypothetical protein
MISYIPSRLIPTDEFLKRKYRHMAAVSEGRRILSYGECSLGGCRYINGSIGVSCHAEINAIKPFYSKLLKGI